MPRLPLGHRVELLLRVAGLVLLVISGCKAARYAAFQAQPELLLKIPGGAPPHAILVGKLEIPRLNMRVAIVEGDDEQSLSIGAGHVPGSAAFGGVGNAVIAGHRDTAFRALRNVRIGDQILIHSLHDAAYRVTSIRTVDPDDISVLRSDAGAKLTLITCFPFYYVGSAPRRFIVEAQLVKG